MIFSLLVLISISGKEDKSGKYDWLVSLQTEYGDIKLILFDDTPVHKKNFIELAQNGMLDGSNFHRVINQFMIQGGEIPLSKKPKGWDTLSFAQKSLPNEIRANHSHIRGAISAARPENPEKRSDKSQFFIVQPYSGTHFLDNNYTVFGQVMSGMMVVDKIASCEVKDTKPIKDVNFTVKVEKVLKTDLIKYYGTEYSEIIK